MSHSEYIDDAHPLAADDAYEGPAWYATDPNGLVAGPFDDVDQSDWWLNKSLRV